MSADEKASSEQRNELLDPLLGKVLNTKFKVLSVIATGGMGTIYRGEQVPLGRPVAIKVLIPNQASRQLDPNFHKRFFLEASTLSRLQHQNIVTVYDYGRIEGLEPERYFMAMEFLPGETLFRRVRRLGRLAPPDAIRIARQIARGLREAHKHGVVHRDLKPSNIMLVPEGDTDEIVKILDFGLVKVLSDDSEELTQQGSFLGSPRFMSPEQISHGKVDLRTDVYSLGVILYQMLCGKVPFESDKSIQILMAHLQTPVPPLSERNPDVDVPELLEALVMRCLAKDPDERPPTMDAVILSLTECAQGMGFTTHITAIDSLPGEMSKSNATLRALKEAVTLPAPEDGESTSASGVQLVTQPTAQEGQAPPVASTKQRKGQRGAIIIAGSIVLAAVLIMLSLRDKSSTVQPPVNPPPDRSERHANSFILIVDSVPQGASVLENGQTLGTTPLQLTIQNDLARVEPRRLTLQKDGYLPYSLVQGPLDNNVRLPITLIPAPQPMPQPTVEVTSEPSIRPSIRPIRPTPTTSVSAPRPQPTDIRPDR